MLEIGLFRSRNIDIVSFWLDREVMFNDILDILNTWREYEMKGRTREYIILVVP